MLIGSRNNQVTQQTHKESQKSDFSSEIHFGNLGVQQKKAGTLTLTQGLGRQLEGAQLSDI